jgi:predicted  nucleic acid-binding Zn-ribbon protein
MPGSSRVEYLLEPTSEHGSSTDEEELADLAEIAELRDIIKEQNDKIAELREDQSRLTATLRAEEAAIEAEHAKLCAIDSQIAPLVSQIRVSVYYCTLLSLLHPLHLTKSAAC